MDGYRLNRWGVDRKLSVAVCIQFVLVHLAWAYFIRFGAQVSFSREGTQGSFSIKEYIIGMGN